MKRILVTGASGFLGYAVKKVFDSINNFEFYYTRGTKVDLTEAMQVNYLLNEIKPHMILHMAAVCGGIMANKNNPAKYLFSNMQMGLNIFELAHIHKVEKVITIGSVCSYPKFCPTPFKETSLWEGYPEETNAPYGFAKRGLLMLQNAYRQQYGIKGAHIILANMYGPNDHFDPKNSHVIPALIKKFSDAVKKNESEVICWGSGNCTREFLYSRDAAKVLSLVLEKDLDEELPINIGNGIEISIHDLAVEISKIAGYTGNIVFANDNMDGQPKRCLDITRMKNILQYYPETTLEEGLKETYNYWNSQGIL
jgi:GDP-L-fucose synthase